MTAVVSMNTMTFSCSSAAAGTSARKIPLMDTASLLAVSICILPLRITELA